MSEDSKRFCALRVAHFTGEDGDDDGKDVRWRENTRFQRVKFEWYIELNSLPPNYRFDEDHVGVSKVE